MRDYFKKFNLRIYLLLFTTLMFFVFVSSISWDGTPWSQPFNVDEDGLPSIYFNISENITFIPSELPLRYAYGADTNITSTLYGSQYTSYFYWINLDTTGGNFTINSTNDNETGQFNASLDVYNDDEESAGARIFIFIINATNDEPIFTNIKDSYLYPTNGSEVSYFINLTDEEEHYPLNFSIEFFDNCTHANWVGRVDGENCSILNLTNQTDGSSAFINYSVADEDIGMYWAQLTVTEAEHDCPHVFCDNATYETPHVLRYNFSIEVLSRLYVNASQCINMNFTEGIAKNCTLEVRTRQDADAFNISSLADFLTYGGTPSDSHWFFDSAEYQATNFRYEFNVTVNSTHSLVGDWKINFSVDREGTSEFNWTSFDIFVNWTGNNAPNFSSLEEQYNTSVNYNLTVPLTVNDYDFVIEDKDFWNEDQTLSIEMINLSSGNPITPFYDLDEISVYGYSNEFNLTFNPVEGEEGSYNVTINTTDSGGINSSTYFTLNVIDNEYPYWNQTNYLFYFEVNSTVATTLSNLTDLNLTRTYANDSDEEDLLNFSLSGNYPPDLSLTTDGIMNFSPWKNDVGYWSFNITVTDEMQLSNISNWVFNVTNINSAPWVDEDLFYVNNGTELGGNNLNVTVNQSTPFTISFITYDNDLLINDTQISQNGIYNETLDVINTNITNNTQVSSPIELDFYRDPVTVDNKTWFYANFTPDYQHVGKYTVVVNVSDNSSETDSFSFEIEVLEQNSFPEVESIGDLETSILNRNFYYDVNATDSEDDYDGVPLFYSLSNVTPSAPPITINSSTGNITFDFEENQSYAGVFEYMVRVNDSDSAYTDEYFNLTVYGLPNITSPTEGYVFDSLEENNTYVLNFTVDYMINYTNLTYFVYLDNVSCSWINRTENNKSCNYTNLTSIDSDSFNWSSGTNLSINLSLGYFDETYGLNKNLSLLIYNPDYPALNDSINYSVNVSHKNYNVSSIDDISDISAYKSTAYYLDLRDYFYDIDYEDEYHEQTVNFSLNQSSNSELNILSGSSIDGWNLSLFSSLTGTANVSVNCFEWNESDSIIRNISSNWFLVTFSDLPTQTVPNPSSGGSSSRKTEKVVEHYSLKIITPGDMEITPDQQVLINFSVINDGDVDLYGINLSSYIDLGGVQTNDITVALSETFIDHLAVDEKKDYSLGVRVNTEAYGDYRITVYGNVTTPKMNDWADFFIKVMSLDKAELSELLIFTEKMVSENPECIELRESYNLAAEAYQDGDYAKAKSIAQETISACEDSITANEQIRFFDERISLSLLYMIVITLVLFVAGFIYYFYRRIKFKKLIAKDYI